MNSVRFVTDLIVKMAIFCNKLNCILQIRRVVIDDPSLSEKKPDYRGETQMRAIRVRRWSGRGRGGNRGSSLLG